mgnify:CR=1 FL=1
MDPQPQSLAGRSLWPCGAAGLASLGLSEANQAATRRECLGGIAKTYLRKNAVTFSPLSFRLGSSCSGNLEHYKFASE